MFFSRAPLLPCTLALLFLCFPPVVHADWGPDVRLTYNGSVFGLCGNSAQAIAADTQGGVHLVWDDGRDGNEEIYYKRSFNRGDTWEPDVRLTYHSSFSSCPAVAVDDSGCVHVVWEDRRVGNLWEIYYKRSTDRGTTWGNDTLLSDPQRTSWYPAIAAGEHGTLHVLWWNADPAPDSSHIYYRRSLDKGETWEPVRILGDTLCRAASIVAVPGGLCHIASAGIFYRRSTDSGTTWSRDTLFTPTSVADGPCIHSDERGNVHLAWQDQGRRMPPYLDIYYKRSTDQGVTWEPEQQMTFTDDIDESAPVVAEDDSGLVHLLYRVGGGQGIFYRCSTNGGVSWSPAVPLIPQVYSFRPHIVVDNSRFAHVVWVDGRDGNSEIYYKRWECPSGVASYTQQSAIDQPVLTIVPNPFTSFATVPDREREWFFLYDISGRRVGVYKGDRIGEGLSPGVYFLKLEGKESKPLRIVKLR